MFPSPNLTNLNQSLAYRAVGDALSALGYPTVNFSRLSPLLVKVAPGTARYREDPLTAQLNAPTALRTFLARFYVHWSACNELDSRCLADGAIIPAAPMDATFDRYDFAVWVPTLTRQTIGNVTSLAPKPHLEQALVFPCRSQDREHWRGMVSLFPGQSPPGIVTRYFIPRALTLPFLQAISPLPE